MRIGRWTPRRPTLARRNSVSRHGNQLEQYLDSEPFGTSDQALLCCFGLDKEASATRSSAQLRRALVDAGFRVTVARHLIRSSPLLRRTGDGRYRLRDFDG
jgi:hypothetical protein